MKKTLLSLCLAGVSWLGQSCAYADITEKIGYQRPTVVHIKDNEPFVAINLQRAIEMNPNPESKTKLGSQQYGEFEFTMRSVYRYKSISERLSEVAKVGDVIFMLTTGKAAASTGLPATHVFISVRYLDQLPSDNLAQMLAHEMGHIVLNKQGRDKGLEGDDLERASNVVADAIMREAGWYHPCLSRQTYLKLTKLRAETYEDVPIEREQEAFQQCMAREAQKKSKKQI